MNSINVSGIIRGQGPSTKQLGEVLTCSCVLDFDEWKLVQIYAMGRAARQLSQLLAGDSVRVEGRLGFSPGGTTQIIAREISLLEVVCKKIDALAEKSA